MSLRKPTSETATNPAQLLTVLVGLYEAIAALQAVQNSSIKLLGAVPKDPGKPPVGTVYLYTIAGSLYARTTTAAYQLAL